MQIAKHKVVSIDYTLTDPAGKVLDSSKGKQPLAYIHGTGGLIPGLENALEGKTKGEALKVTIAPEDGYGRRDDAMVQLVPHDTFKNIKLLEVGMQFRANNQGRTQIVTVVGFEKDNVKVDANHPLAGVTLSFDVKVVEVREATQEEISHGHVHGPGGHHH